MFCHLSRAMQVGLSTMNSSTRPVDWNAFTWIGVLIWLTVAVAVCANFTWPIDRTATLRKFNDFREEVEKLHPDVANSLPWNFPIHIRSGYPFTYIERDLNSNATLFMFPMLVLNLLICVASTVSLAFVSQRYLQRYSVCFLLIATTTIACLLAVGQLGARLVQNVGASTIFYYDNLFRTLFVSPIVVVLFLVARSLWLKQINAEPRHAHDALDRPF